MLFNSLPFLLCFLPIALCLHWLCERFRPQWHLPVLALLSFIFYGYWDWHFVPLLLISIIVNWSIAVWFVERGKPFLIVLAIAANLLVLGFFKYAAFVISFVPSAGEHPALTGINSALPLGISFFTFHHIMYLVDLKAK